MNVRCPDCNATLKYSPDLGKMYCAFCGNTYETDELNSNADDSSGLDESVKIRKRHADTIQMQMVHCTSCGAKLAMNYVEISSYCAYCGQPTIVKDRIEDYLKPDYIIPFKITKEEALKILKHNIKNGIFIPNDMQDIQIDRLCGIYIPFWLYDVYCEDEEFWSCTNNSRNGSHTLYMFRVANARFTQFTVDGSERLIDVSTQRLEPYDMQELIPFDPSYLSGFYADRFDTTADKAKSNAQYRLDEMIKNKVKKTLPSKSVLLSRHPKAEFEDEHYALLPAWFMTFIYKGNPITVIINGQTGKMVGAFPFSKIKVTFVFLLFAIVFSLIASKLFAYPIMSLGTQFFVGGCLLVGLFWKLAISKIKSVMRSMVLTNSIITRNYVEERQDEQ